MRPCDALVAALTPVAQSEAGSSVAVCRVLAAPFYRGLAAVFLSFLFFFFKWPSGSSTLFFIYSSIKVCVFVS